MWPVFSTNCRSGETFLILCRSAWSHHSRFTGMGIQGVCVHACVWLCIYWYGILLYVVFVGVAVQGCDGHIISVVRCLHLRQYIWSSLLLHIPVAGRVLQTTGEDCCRVLRVLGSLWLKGLQYWHVKLIPKRAAACTTQKTVAMWPCVARPCCSTCW